MTKTKKLEELEMQNAELLADLQRMRADFENHLKRTDQEKAASKQAGEEGAIMKLLPVIDTIERAVSTIPDDIRKHAWVQGIQGLSKNLQSALQSLGLARIEASPGTVFDPGIHQALQFDEDSEGETEVITQELQAGYRYRTAILRPSLVNVARK